MFWEFQAITFLILSSTYVKAQQQPNLLYGFAPSQYGAYYDDPQWRRYNIPLARVPYNTGYYASPGISPSLPQQLPASALSTTPTRFFASPYQTYAHYGQHHSTPLLEHSTKLPHQQTSHQNLQQDQLRRAAPQIVQQERNEGNFYRQRAATQNRNATVATQRNYESESQKPKFVGNTAGYTVFEHKVLHVTTPVTPVDAKDYRKRRSFSPEMRTDKAKFRATNSTNIHVEPKHVTRSKDYSAFRNDTQAVELPKTYATKDDNAPTQRKARYFHDIFMHYADPQSIAYGHVERQPLRSAKRFESLNNGNRYRGEVTWADTQTGGYGSQYWDLVQGKI